jgi:hypothetical protein
MKRKILIEIEAEDASCGPCYYANCSDDWCHLHDKELPKLPGFDLTRCPVCLAAEQAADELQNYIDSLEARISDLTAENKAFKEAGK